MAKSVVRKPKTIKRATKVRDVKSLAYRHGGFKITIAKTKRTSVL